MNRAISLIGKILVAFLCGKGDIKKKLQPNKTNYVFLDEVQNISSFEKLVDGLFATENTDIYITGSNAFLLSSELATLLSGRYIEISILPFSFKEYLIARNIDLENKYLNYESLFFVGCKLRLHSISWLKFFTFVLN